MTAVLRLAESEAHASLLWCPTLFPDRVCRSYEVTRTMFIFHVRRKHVESPSIFEDNEAE